MLSPTLHYHVLMLLMDDLPSILQSSFALSVPIATVISGGEREREREREREGGRERE